MHCNKRCNQPDLRPDHSEDTMRSCGRAIARLGRQKYDMEGGVSNRPTIAELEAILEKEDEVEIEILPNGEVRAKGQTTDAERGGRKPLTMREDLGGEY